MAKLIKMPEIVTVEGKSYFGYLVKSGAGFVIRDSMLFDEESRIFGSLKKYFVKFKMGELFDVEISGECPSITKRRLNKKNQGEFDFLVIAMNDAEERAPKEVVAQYFKDNS